METGKSDDGMDALSDDMSATYASVDKHFDNIQRRLIRWEWERNVVSRLRSRLDREYDVAGLRVVSAGNYSHRFYFRVRPVWETRFVEVVEAGVDEGRITEDEADAIERTDIVARAWRRSDEARLWFAVQASATIDNDDIERAAAGAVALRKVSGEDAAAAVYGRRIAAQQRVRAEELEVAVILDEDGGQEWRRRASPQRQTA